MKRDHTDLQVSTQKRVCIHQSAKEQIFTSRDVYEFGLYQTGGMLNIWKTICEYCFSKKYIIYKTCKYENTFIINEYSELINNKCLYLSIRFKQFEMYKYLLTKIDCTTVYSEDRIIKSYDDFELVPINTYNTKYTKRYCMKVYACNKNCEEALIGGFDRVKKVTAYLKHNILYIACKYLCYDIIQYEINRINEKFDIDDFKCLFEMCMIYASKKGNLKLLRYLSKECNTQVNGNCFSIALLRNQWDIIQECLHYNIYDMRSLNTGAYDNRNKDLLHVFRGNFSSRTIYNNCCNGYFEISDQYPDLFNSKIIDCYVKYGRNDILKDHENLINYHTTQTAAEFGNIEYFELYPEEFSINIWVNAVAEEQHNFVQHYYPLYLKMYNESQS